MIQVRDVFQLKFGKAREAVAVFQEGLGLMRAAGTSNEMRMLTDLAGQYYTLVLESTYESLSAYETEMRRGMTDPRWKEWYDRVTPLVESGHRELFNIVGVSAPYSMAGQTETMAAGR